MLNKFIKRGSRKGAKLEAAEPGGNVTVNHASRSAMPSVATSTGVRVAGGGGSPNRLPTSAAGSAAMQIESLPLFRDVSVPEHQALFLRKLKICAVVFNFSETLRSARETEIKRQTLSELVDFVQSGSGRLTESVQEELVRTVTANIFRCLPPNSHENTGSEVTDPEEDDPFLDPAWPHLQLVYELLLRYIVSSDTDTKVAKRYIDHSFVLRLLDLFDSEDPREREYLKTILHRIYGKFMVHRPFIRKAINNIFYGFIFEIERHSGINELLEILGSIINGFALPMKEEHKLFLVRALIPLHKPKSVGLYHQQLSYCIVQFVDKDYKLADIVIRGLLKYWPVTNCQKEVLFLGELEEVLEATQPAEFQRCMVSLFKQIALCLSSFHFQNAGGDGTSYGRNSFPLFPLRFHCTVPHATNLHYGVCRADCLKQVAERALFFWNNDHIVSLIAQNRREILPIIFKALEKNTEGHWNLAINGLTANVRKMFLDMDSDLFEACQRQYVEKQVKTKSLEEQRDLQWRRLEEAAAEAKAAGEDMVIVN